MGESEKGQGVFMTVWRKDLGVDVRQMVGLIVIFHKVLLAVTDFRRILAGDLINLLDFGSNHFDV